MKIHCFGHRMFNTSTLFSPIKLPSQMETHLWYTLPNEVKSESLLSQYVDLLPPHEKDHIFSITNLQLQKTALLARALVRTTISRYQRGSKISPRSLEFKKNTHGKPEVIWQSKDDWNPPPLHFNISHTSSLIACGVTVDSLEKAHFQAKSDKRKKQYEKDMDAYNDKPAASANDEAGDDSDKSKSEVNDEADSDSGDDEDDD